MSSRLTNSCIAGLAISLLGFSVQAGTFKSKPAEKDTLRKTNFALGQAYVPHKGGKAKAPNLGIPAYSPAVGQAFEAPR